MADHDKDDVIGRKLRRQASCLKHAQDRLISTSERINYHAEAEAIQLKLTKMIPGLEERPFACQLKEEVLLEMLQEVS